MKPQPLLDGLLVPSDLRRFGSDELKRLADEIRYRIKETVSANGGHLASNLGVVELTLALHRCFDFASDRLLFDVGHQAYVHKLITGRAGRFASNRTAGGISGFPDPKESPYDLFKVGHSSTAISSGVGLSEGYRRLGQKRRTVVVVGDGALTGGMAFEGLINAGDLDSQLIVVLNDNGNFIDKPVGSLHRYLDRIRTGRFVKHVVRRLRGILRRMPWGDDLGRMAEQVESAALKLVHPGYIFEDLGLTYLGPTDGHDIDALEELFRRVDSISSDGPFLLHVHTAKGGGWQPSADDPLLFHGPSNFDIDTGLMHPKPPAGPTWSQVFADAMSDLADEDERVVGVTAAMPSGTGLLGFAKRHPDRMYDVGICEQHSFAFVQGLIASGMRPILAHYSTFAQRGYDQLFQECVVQRDLGMVITLDRAGLVGEDGETHQGLYDIAWSRCFPGLVLLSPSTDRELAAMLRWAHSQRLSENDRAAGYLIRYPKGSATVAETEPAPIELGRAVVSRRGGGPLQIWAYGPLHATVLAAVDELGAAAEGVTVVNARFAKPFDDALLKELASDHPVVLTVEDHALAGGFGTIVAEAIADAGTSLTLRRCGVDDRLIAHAKRSEQLAECGLDVAGLRRSIEQALGTAREAIPFRSRRAGRRA